MKTLLPRSTPTLFSAIAIASALALSSPPAWADCGSARPAKPDDAITVVTSPAVPAVGDNEFTVTVRDANCSPIVGATVTVELVMPAMPGMPEMRNTVALAPAKDAKAAQAGVYTGRGQIFMAGKWTVTVTATVKGVRVASRALTIQARPHSNIVVPGARRLHSPPARTSESRQHGAESSTHGFCASTFTPATPYLRAVRSLDDPAKQSNCSRISTGAKPAARRISGSSAAGRAPAIQPVHKSMSRLIDSSSSAATTMSA